jgi:regulatory protein
MKRAKKLAVDELFAYAVKKLSGRAASIGEIRSSLLSRAAQASDVEEVLTRLKEYGYLNDPRFAESFASARLENQGLGRLRVISDLRRRRVAPELAERTATRIYAQSDECTLIEQYVRRRYRSADRDELFKSNNELAAAYRRLLRAGFTPANSARVLKRFAANPELLDGLEES